nr:SDR family oxidoreductase [Kutzneria buriramensis]WKX06507.1 SDR family oxidoreductase [Kutzneria buriramensis]
MSASTSWRRARRGRRGLGGPGRRPGRDARAVPPRRVGDPEDIAATVAFLAARDASWITRTTLTVDGRRHRGRHGIRRALSRPGTA